MILTIKEYCTGLPEHWQHCILYNCDTCAFRHNLEEICGRLTEKKRHYNIDNIYYTLNKFFVLHHCYWGFGQPDREKYDPYYDHLNLNLPAFAICRYTWNIY